MSLARYKAVASPSTLGLVATMTSCTTLPRKPREQSVNAKLRGSDAGERIEYAVQHVIAAPKSTGLLDSNSILRLRDHTNDGGVAARIGTNLAAIGRTQVGAHGAQTQIFVHVTQGVGKR